MIEFDAYARDCRVYGEIELEQGRLSDQLNCAMEILIRNARIADLGDGHVVELPELTVGRDELCAVVATGPRGDDARRLNTRTALVEANIGPYRVEGWAHSPPAADPVASILRRAAWVPLTDATVWYNRSGEDVREKVPTLLVNRHLMRTFRAVKEARPALPTPGGSPSSTASVRLRPESRNDLLSTKLSNLQNVPLGSPGSGGFVA
jgi:hypothetical protein